ncbi:MAG: CapA family protein [Brevinematales bacterium]|nr:CapA family protein [Brevinematales bacterium]
MRKYIILLIFTTICYAKESQIELVVAGDIFPSPSLISSGISKEGRNYLPYYEFVTNIIAKADLAISWFGGPVAGSGEKFSGSPVYNNPPEFITAAIAAGFDLFFHTNHLLDRGLKGLIRTIEFFKTNGSVYLGTYLSEEESKKIYYFEKNGIKIAILSYLYGANAKVKTEKWMINYIDPLKISNDIAKAKTEKADFVIVGLHWGNEYERFPSKEQKSLAKYIISSGADMILGSHPHVIQPAELIDGKFVIYSFGNFLSSQRKRYTDAGLIAKFIIEKKDGKTFLKKASYIPTWVKWKLNPDGKKYTIRILPIPEFDKKYKKKETKILSKEEYEKMMIAFKDTISHLNNTNIPFLYEEE